MRQPKILPTAGKEEVNTTNEVQETNKELPVDMPNYTDNQGAQAELKAKQFDKDELLQIFDEILFSGEYIEDITINGKLKIAFKARSAQETTEISREIDGKNFSLIATMQEYRALLNLAYSLVSYAGKDLSKSSLEDRRTFVGKLPTAVVAIISDKLLEFDRKVDAACREGEENF